jgi:hypothetical protein
VWGGSGDDTLIGGDGNDIFDHGICDAGADEFIGGGGHDTVSYTKCGARISVTLDDVADDGATDEGDNVHGDIDTVEGTRYRDRLIETGTGTTFSGTAART